MALRHLLLGLLAERPDHAYALKHRLSPGVPRKDLINDGVLYPLLATLESQGFVEGSEQRGPTGRSRRVYSVTSAGRAEFTRWLHSDEDEADTPMYELFIGHPLVKLLFASDLGRDQLQTKLDRHTKRVADRIDALESLGSIAPRDAAGGLGRSLRELELRHLRDRLEWLRSERSRL